ncbi:enoyl-CoA hydratase-related protein [Flexibacterium corallicola]|uniref:enoyl-CoA hydratase-related protein n=1 Tax=Flexibacterium corallicola TaxID=3037259 RepID=UPI00286F4225|nr:enoyl-CoA hydratase-related protein [Pseudovibrio sp. M1P-2-3]
MNFETLELSRDESGIATLQLNRPNKHNAMNALMMDELCAAADFLDDDEQTRVVVIKGSGKTFCAGGDLNWMKAQVSTNRDGKIKEASRLADMLKRLDDLKKPVIGQVGGNAFGGGLGLVSICDIVVATPNLRFALTETRLGLIPATIGLFVVRKIGEGAARQIFMNSKPFGTERAYKLGFVSEIVAEDKLEEAAYEEARAFLNCAPGAVKRAKDLCKHLARTSHENPLNYSVEELADCWESDEGSHGIDAFFAKEKPRWQS